ncbi:MAG: glutathione S-transferase C-terminal domain-containing protein [Caulobacterales bacterium]|nr:glutathione S-transferase C-terminal domain-containing protein [Caulobacterales bacterium]
MALTLYFAAGSSSLPALVGLEEAGADFEPVRLVLAKGDQRTPQYLAVYPRGRVPLLVVDGQTIGENVAILATIANLFPRAGLLPLADPVELGRAYELLAWFASSIHVAFAQVSRPERYTRDQAAWPALKAGGRENMLAAYAEIEARLADGRPWLLGDTFSLADPYALVFHRWAERLDVDMAAYPAYSAHAARVRARPSVQRALAQESSPRVLVGA